MTLPHNFAPGTDLGIATGTWYRLDPAGRNHIVKAPVYLPVLGEQPVSFSQNHQWSEADNMTKNIMGNFTSKIPLGLGNMVSAAAARAVGSSGLVDNTSGGPHISACSVYTDSDPPTIAVRSKLFSPDGSGSLLALLETLRADFTGSLGGSGWGGSIISKIQSTLGSTAASVAQNIGSVAKVGIVSHPEWWTVEVISFAGGSENIIMKMTDMIPFEFGFVLHSPYIGNDPSMVELSIGFKHGFRGTRESMSMGGAYGFSSPASKPSSPSQPKSTPTKTSQSPQGKVNTTNSKTNPSMPKSQQSFRESSPLLGGIKRD